MATQSDSPLSITASIAGILTFVVAILAAVFVRFNYLRNADSEYFQVKTSLSWYKTESTFMHDLIHSRDPRSNGNEMEYEMYAFVVDQLGKLEERLLDLLSEAEEKAIQEDEEDGKRWTLIPKSVRFRTSIAMSWLPVRAKALELVRQRDALGSRVLFAQISMISSRARHQETRSRKTEESHREHLERLEAMVYSQHEKLDRLEGQMHGAMHRDRIGFDGDSESPEYKEVPPAAKGNKKDKLTQTVAKPEVTAHHYPVSSI